MANYRLRPTAESDLVSIWQCTQQHWGIEQARLYFDTLVSAFQTLAQTPAPLATIPALTFAVR